LASIKPSSVLGSVSLEAFLFVELCVRVNTRPAESTRRLSQRDILRKVADCELENLPGNSDLVTEAPGISAASSRPLRRGVQVIVFHVIENGGATA
jgi:hypothetical protein